MFDVNVEDLLETIDRQVADLLNRYSMVQPPVDAVQLVQDAFDMTIREAEDDREERQQYGYQPPRRRSREIVFQPHHSEEARHALCARACARALIPAVLTKLGIVPGTESRSAPTQLAGLITPRLLLPTRWFEKEARRRAYDLWELKEVFSTASYEMIALRWLDGEEPCVLAIIDDGSVAMRRSNRTSASKTLHAAEQRCLERVTSSGEPQTARQSDWTTWGWPIPTGPFNRIVLRSVPDDI